MYKRFLKPILDFSIALTVLFVFSPVILLVILFLAIANSGKVFFFQARTGKDKREFKVVKFKTMNDKRDADGNLLPDAERLTPVGAFVRKTSLDELPQLINVLKMDMSLIGPRPFLAEYLPLYSEEELKRFRVRPGITGWAQVNGRNAITWKKKFELDIWYVENYGPLLDLKIIYLTILNMVRAKDISAGNHVTAEKYNGYN